MIFTPTGFGAGTGSAADAKKEKMRMKTAGLPDDIED
jgi:hypothetical protein